MASRLKALVRRSEHRTHNYPCSWTVGTGSWGKGGANLTESVMRLLGPEGGVNVRWKCREELLGKRNRTCKDLEVEGSWHVEDLRGAGVDSNAE